MVSAFHSSGSNTRLFSSAFSDDDINLASQRRPVTQGDSKIALIELFHLCSRHRVYGKVWNTATGDELLTLDGHRNVVYAIAFNNPWGNKIITGSFDKTCKLWNAQVGVGSRASRATIYRSSTLCRCC